MAAVSTAASRGDTSSNSWHIWCSVQCAPLAVTFLSRRSSVQQYEVRTLRCCSSRQFYSLKVSRIQEALLCVAWHQLPVYDAMLPQLICQIY